MSRSSAAYSNTTTIDASEAYVDDGRRAVDSRSWSLAENVFRIHNHVEEVAGARLAGRLNAAAISEDEILQLRSVRRELLSKVLDGTISVVEGHKLKYVNWNLETIEDARHGADLDRLQATITKYGKFREEIDELKEYLDNAGRNG